VSHRAPPPIISGSLWFILRVAHACFHLTGSVPVDPLNDGAIGLGEG
jgi:hypothetical protein